MKTLFMLVFVISCPTIADAHCKYNHPGHCMKEAVEAPVRVTRETVKVPVKVTTETLKETGKRLGSLGGEVGKVGEKVEKASGDVQSTHSKAIEDVSKTFDKATKDVDATLRKAGKDVNDASIAIGKYIERQVQGTGETISSADKRIREGKFVDAIWHLGTDPASHTEKNAAKLAQESTLVNALAQVAASAYGGPQGAAAYAAWYTYRATGDVGLALRVGLTVGVTAVAMGAVGEMPTATTEQLIKKAAVTGAIGGIGVAASGGDEQAIYEGFLRSGGMVLVQDGYKKYTGHTIDARGAEGEAYCIDSLNESCSPPPEAYIRNKDGSIATNRDGTPKVDMKFLDKRRPHVGITSVKDATGSVHQLMEEGGFAMDFTAKSIPVTQAGSVLHDQWAIQWDMNRAMNLATIAPAMVMTYYGTDGAITDLMLKTAVAGKRGASSEPIANQQWASTLARSDGFAYVAFRCNTGKLTRIIQIDMLINKDVKVCRVLYKTEKGTSTPWYAQQDADYCLPKGVSLVDKQIQLGWSCDRI
ncbi:MAG TPA: hypothetical protein PKN47_21795 [Nitrospira sp.]|jgi:hypothetical protein|nr:hypothetical protein [Nitrospira sp.]